MVNGAARYWSSITGRPGATLAARKFVGISIDDASKIIEFQKETPTTYPLLIGDIGTMKNSADLGNTRQALPFTAVFDRQGKLALTKLGRLSEKELEPELADLASRSQ